MTKGGGYFLGGMIIIFLLSTYSSFGQRNDEQFRHKRPISEHIVLADSTLNAIGIDSLVNKIEITHFTLNRINNALSVGFDTREIEQNFPGVDTSIDIISANVSLYTRVLDVKNLQLFDGLLTDMQQNLNEWRAQLSKYNKQIGMMRGEILAIRGDSILRLLIIDTAFANLYGTELTAMKSRWRQALDSINASAARISHLQTELSNEYFESLELQTQVSELLRKGTLRSQGKEYPYLWELTQASEVKGVQNDSLSQQSYKGQRRILAYYFLRNWDDLVWMILTGALFVFWVHRNYKKTLNQPQETRGTPFQPLYISVYPVLSTLVVIFNVVPFFNLHPPTAYVSLMQFLLIIVLTFLFWKHWPKNLFRYWLAMGALYLVFSFAGILLNPGLFFRLMLVAVNVLSVLLGLMWIRNFRQRPLNFSGMILFVSWVYVALNAGAVLCNLFGRLSLAKIFSVTAIFSLTQIIGLSVFIETILEASELQTRVNQARGGLIAQLNYSRIQQPLRRVLNLLSFLIWAFVFTVSLNIYNYLIDQVGEMLTRPRKIGNTTFELGNILLFILVLYVSHQLQKGVGSLYGKSKTENWDPVIRKNASRLAILRLFLIVIGFLIAVAASGLPVDKITIVLGALGVGIGLGLQNIVNSFVSGIILIFEQPFRIGDYIEIGDRKGRVADIGIRSSKLMMQEGAEVIIPNGDLLSGRVINWTIHGDTMRIELPISIETGHSFDEISTAILDVLKKNENVIKNSESSVLLTSVTEKTMNVNVLAWVRDVQRVQFTKGILLKKILEQLESKGFKIL